MMIIKWLSVISLVPQQYHIRMKNDKYPLATHPLFQHVYE